MIMKSFVYGLNKSYQKKLHFSPYILYFNFNRFKFGAENEDKIRKIVKGQYAHLSEIYRNIMLDEKFKSLLTLHENERIIEIKAGSKTKGELLNMVPSGIGSQLGGFTKDYKTIMNKMEIEEMQRSLAKGLQKINQWSSTRMLLYHAFTTSPAKNIIYVWAKIKKRFFKK